LTTYAVQAPPHAGAQLTFTNPPANADLAPTGTGIGLLVVNPSGGSTITISIPELADDGLTVGPRVISIAAGATWLIPMTSQALAVGNASLTYTGTLTGVLVAAITIP
jgi:hypothetical protein